MTKTFKEYITESFSKSFSYRIKLAGDYGPSDSTYIENILGKYGVQSVSSFNRTPIQEEPLDFKHKDIKYPTEVSSCDVVLQYPINERLLEVWMAVHLGVSPENVVVQPTEGPRQLEDNLSKERAENDKDRYADMDEAELTTEEQAHYENEQQFLDLDELGMYGEEFNEKFIAELKKVRDEKGADYFRNYPSKSMMMGDDLKPLADAVGLAHKPNVQGNSYDINQGPVSQ